jgi:hypothetical protein
VADVDHKGRKWAGSKDRQKFLTNRIVREGKLSRENPIDVAGAVGTITANAICDYAKNYADAVEGLTAHYGDMMEVLRQRFREGEPS